MSAEEHHRVLRSTDPEVDRLREVGWRVVAESWGARLRLEEPPDLARARDAVQAARAGGYDVRELDRSERAAVAGLEALTAADYPWTPATDTPARTSARLVELDARCFGALADGWLVAVTAVIAGPDRVETEFTSVHGEHRRRGLAVAVKAASVLALADDGPPGVRHRGRRGQRRQPRDEPGPRLRRRGAVAEPPRAGRRGPSEPRPRTPRAAVRTLRWDRPAASRRRMRLSGGMIAVRGVVVPLLVSLSLVAPGAVVATAHGHGAPPRAAGPSERSAEARNPARTFLSLNVAGKLQNKGRVDPVASDLVRAVRKRSPYAAVLQEVCSGQAWAVNRRLAKYRVMFFPTGVQCPGGQGFGNAVLIRNGPLARRQESLPTGGDGSRNIGCVSRTSPRVAVCSTHLTADRARGADRRRQARKVARVSRDFVDRGYATFVGGDFNDTPGADTLDPMYRPAYGQGAFGIHTESNGCCGRDGDPTLGTSKFDYGFASRQWRVVRGFTADAPHSDHDRLWTILRRR